MPSDSNLPNLPPSPIENEDLWLINREDKSYKVNSAQLGSYIVQLPIPETCDDTSDCPSGYVCKEGFCARQPCDDDNPCDSDYACYGGYCYPICELNTGIPCTDGYVCVDPGLPNTGPICLPYPFPNNPEIPTTDGCPINYVNWGDYCWHECNSSLNCPPGMECVDSGEVGDICVYPEGGFPCVEGNCPDGFDCFFGMCFAKCDGTPGSCGDGFQCVDVSGNGDNYCVPYPFPCDLYGTGCPPGMTCYNGDCYPDCTPGGDPCEAGYQCITIGNGNSICYPDVPEEKFVNDGPLVFKGEDADGNPSEEIVFTANQFGRSVVNLKGFIISGTPGGGSGGEINIDIDTGATLWTDTGSEYFPKRENRSILPNGSGSIGGPSEADRWDNLYTNDLHLSNEGKSNDVDGTWGDWTIQEGEDELYLLNNRNGKKYSFVLKEVIN